MAFSCFRRRRCGRLVWSEKHLDPKNRGRYDFAQYTQNVEQMSEDIVFLFCFFGVVRALVTVFSHRQAGGEFWSDAR